MELTRDEVFTKKDCIPMTECGDIEGEIVVVPAEALAEPYRKPKFQLWKAGGGFGCRDHTTGQAVYARCLADDENARWRRHDFIGVLKEEVAEEVGLNE